MNTTAKKATKNTTATKTVKKEETKMAKNVKNTKPAVVEKSEKAPAPVDKKAEYCKAVEKWISEFKSANPEKKVEVKTWEKLPAFYSIKIDGTLYFEVHASRNGVRPDTKSKYIPEHVRPEGSRIIKNGLDLYTPAQEDINILTVYAATICKSLEDAKRVKEEARKEKENARKAKPDTKTAKAKKVEPAKPAKKAAK